MMRLALFASGGGTNLQAILDACNSGEIDARPVVVIGNNSKAAAMQRAAKAGVPIVHLSSVTHPDPADLDDAMLKTLVLHEVDLIALAGYVKQLGPKVITAYRNRVLNIHPAPIPEFGGPGMYGLKVHETVLQSGTATSGPVVHLVDEEYDHGDVVATATVPVLADDTAETLQARVRDAEFPLYVGTLRRIASGELVLPD